MNVMDAIAGGLASGLVEQLFIAGSTAAAKLLSVLGRKMFRVDDAAKSSAGFAELDEGQVKSLLVDAISNDPAFRDELAGAWKTLLPEIESLTGQANNVVEGSIVEKLVQANIIHGDINM